MEKKPKNTEKFNENSSKFAIDVVTNENVIRKDGFTLVFPFLGTAGATAANYDQVYTCMRSMEIVSVSECHSVPSASGTLQIEKLTGTQAPGAGASILTTAISTSGTANTVITRQGSQLSSNRQLKPGDRIAFVGSGTLTGLVGLHVTLYCKMSGRGDYY